MQDRDEGGIGAEEGQEEEPEGLVDGDVEEEVLGVVGFDVLALRTQVVEGGYGGGPGGCGGGWVLEGARGYNHTNRIDIKFNPRTHDLVPAVDTPDQPSATFETAGSAEGVCEAGVRGEVFLNGHTLCFGG